MNVVTWPERRYLSITPIPLPPPGQSSLIPHRLSAARLSALTGSALSAPGQLTPPSTAPLAPFCPFGSPARPSRSAPIARALSSTDPSPVVADWPYWRWPSRPVRRSVLSLWASALDSPCAGLPNCVALWTEADVAPERLPRASICSVATLFCACPETSDSALGSKESLLGAVPGSCVSALNSGAASLPTLTPGLCCSTEG